MSFIDIIVSAYCNAEQNYCNRVTLDDFWVGHQQHKPWVSITLILVCFHCTHVSLTLFFDEIMSNYMMASNSICNLRLADDVDLIGKSKDELAELTNQLDIAATQSHISVCKSVRQKLITVTVQLRLHKLGRGGQAIDITVQGVKPK